MFILVASSNAMNLSEFFNQHIEYILATIMAAIIWIGKMLRAQARRDQARTDEQLQIRGELKKLSDFDIDIKRSYESMIQELASKILANTQEIANIYRQMQADRLEDRNLYYPTSDALQMKREMFEFMRDRFTDVTNRLQRIEDRPR